MPAKQVWKTIVAFAVLFVFLAACKESGFNSNEVSQQVDSELEQGAEVVGERTVQAEEEVSVVAPLPEDSQDKEDVNDLAESGKIEVAKPNKREKKAIERCKKSWGSLPVNRIRQVRRALAEDGLDGKALTLRDAEQNDQPSLTIIYSNDELAADQVWQLENPNGWYCIVSELNHGLTVRLARNARLADSRLADPNGSDELSAVGVYVNNQVSIEWLD